MKTFYYVHTGHRIGLNRFRRACAIINALDDVDITLLCSDFRTAQIAKDFGIKNSVGVDVVRNIPQIALHGDQLIFDSEEANPIMLEDMRNYFSTFIRISDKKEDEKAEKELLISPYLEGKGICNGYAVDEIYFKQVENKIKFSYFFGDDDYEKDLEKHLSFLDGFEPHLQLGFFYFLDYEEMLKKRFTHFHEFEEYEAVIKKSEILLSASPQAVLQSLACGNKPIYFQREDHSTDFQELFNSLGIPIIENYNNQALHEIMGKIESKKYTKIEQNSNEISKFIKENLRATCRLPKKATNSIVNVIKKVEI